MDDLNGLSWSSNSNTPANKPPPMSSGLMFPNIHQNSASSRSTPLSATSNRSNSPSKPAPSNGDSFANLVSFGSAASNKNLSLLEQQKKIEAEKAKKEAEKRSHFESQYGGQNSQFWDSLEHGRTQSPAIGKLSQPVAPPTDEDDLLAAFNSKAPVDASTNFPIPSASPSPRIGTNTPQGSTGGGITMQDNTGGMDAFNDDDPFGLSELKAKSVSRPAPAPAQDDDDDFLGLLGKPVSEIPRQHVAPETRASPSHDRQGDASPMPSNEVDRAIAELVDMGFPADKARQALRTTSSGTDVQGAVGWLLTTAHAEARQKSQGQSPANGHPNDRPDRNQSRNRDAPPWMSEGRSQTPQSRNESRSPAAGERDPAQIAQQFGTKFLKSANTLWKTGSKRFQQAVNEFNAESDPSQPKWMRDASAPREESFSQPRPTRQGDGTGQPQGQNAPSFTDEALLLDSGDVRPRQPPRPSQSAQESRDRPQPSPPAGQRMQSPNFLQRPSRPSSQEPKSRLARFAAEEQSAQNYVSPARRKRPQPQAPPPAAEPDVDLFDSPVPSSNRSKPTPQAKPSPPPARSASIPVRPKGPPRAVPPVSPEALQSTHRHREKAAELYKRGDYAAAHQSFSTALGMLPDKHPITIMIRSNRAMTALKTGEPKTAIDDADIILSVIGNSKGEDEMIELGNGEPAKAMKDFYGKALMRKAEALEQLERWADAAQAWKLAVESGHGGSTSIQGRNRCEKAAGISKPPPKPSAPAKKRAPPAPKKASALSDLGGSTSGQDSQAVSRLREANQAAERADQEKFALTDSVDARITAWKGGKQDNLRALLGSLDSVLWPEAGWKKVGLAELVLPNKVKINYMKGIAKVHPDKISTTATTEQRMIAGAVFGALNEAWDKFRIENNL
ncbi:Ubiquitin-associated/translation elongation factor EF1B N-terminal eukaryote [Penicillium odoratum]|uniref:Ubiquitin-associated/translation elongation factor EF1B N-terminal eukaryote n=1 Tax=Penicillium odoratum TaxID=1167516 RepID=UPI002547D2B0|nr:Ubiquitin-associated/translation elongation factor EF1B N-terminal eukaryote [Penicillium odoratum]KAJ5759834.1 Ubiquitin-associated/translation elongation factor EF1B N-terminal eukaryote [Penicillium odoratum]